MLRNPHHDHQNRPAVQPSLFDQAVETSVVDASTVDTRAMAYTAAMKHARPRRDAIELAIAAEGSHGLIAWEIAELLRIPYTSVQRPLGELVALGRIRKTDRTRPTGHGSPAAVYVSALLAEA